MAVILDRPNKTPGDSGTDRAPSPSPKPSPSPPPPSSRGALAVAAVASMSAGAVHAGAAAAHSEHRQAVFAFVALAVVQLVWGASALARPGRRAALAGLGLALVAVAGWGLAKGRGIPFVDGLDAAEPVRFADTLAAGLALVTAAGAVTALVVPRRLFPRVLTGAALLAVAALTVPGVAAAVDHPHGDGHTSLTSAVPPRPFDPALPIDLGGVAGVSPGQQARAENLLAVTLLRLPQWADPDYAEANGFRSIGDGLTGTEHFVNPSFMADDTILDPDAPESLVFDTTTGTRRLVAAMFMMPPGSTLDDTPDIGGALTQWHIHANLCFDTGGRVAGLTGLDGSCARPLVLGPQAPMIHVWIEPHPCGPFAALEGIGGGQVPEGEIVACDALHGT